MVLQRWENENENLDYWFEEEDNDPIPVQEEAEEVGYFEEEPLLSTSDDVSVSVTDNGGTTSKNLPLEENRYNLRDTSSRKRYQQSFSNLLKARVLTTYSIKKLLSSGVRKLKNR